MAPVKRAANRERDPRKGKEPASSSRPRDRNYSEFFVTKEASERHATWAHRVVTPERGLIIAPKFRPLYGSIEQEMIRREWRLFCDHPTMAGFESIVREFYANYPDKRHGRVYVRGIWVPFTAEVINDYYHLPSYPVGETEYEELLGSEIDNAAVLHRICIPGARWVVGRQNKPLKVSKGPITKEAKAWLYFLAAKVFPTQHHSQIARDRVLLLYAILEGLTIDIGRLIIQHIHYVVLPKTRAGFGHPALITSICLRAGVEIESNEVPLSAPAPIDGITIAQYKEWLPGAAADDEEEDDQQQPDEPETHDAAPSHTAPMEDDWQQRMKEDVRLCVRRTHYAIDQNKYIMAQNEHIMNILSQQAPHFPPFNPPPLGSPPHHFNDPEQQ